jgi:hypothetical protein
MTDNPNSSERSLRERLRAYSPHALQEIPRESLVTPDFLLYEEMWRDADNLNREITNLEAKLQPKSLLLLQNHDKCLQEVVHDSSNDESPEMTAFILFISGKASDLERQIAQLQPEEQETIRKIRELRGQLMDATDKKTAFFEAHKPQGPQLETFTPRQSPPNPPSQQNKEES